MAESTPTTHPPADFGSRFSAFMIDAVLLFAVQWVVVVVLSRQLQAAGMTSQYDCSTEVDTAAGVPQLCEGPNSLLTVLLIMFVFGSTLAYHALFEGLRGATPGKQWMGLGVQGADGAMPIGVERATVRSIVRQAFWIVSFLLLALAQRGVSVPAVLFLLLPVLALAMVASPAFTADGRGVHDRASTSRVVRVRPINDPDAPTGAFGGPLWSDPNQPEDLPEHLDLDEPDETPAESELEREESI